VVRDFIVKLDA
jgi:hypothetical protein